MIVSFAERDEWRSGFRGRGVFYGGGQGDSADEPSGPKGRRLLSKRIATWSIASGRAARRISCGSFTLMNYSYPQRDAGISRRLLSRARNTSTGWA